MKFTILLASLALMQQHPCVVASRLRSISGRHTSTASTPDHSSTPDQQRSLSSNWALCGPEGGKQDWMWVPRQVCDADGAIQCRPGWRETEKDPFCGYEIPECMEGDPCNAGLSGGAKCVEKDPDNGLYECVCDFGLNGSNDRGFGPTNCEPTCVAAPGLCDTANGGFCTIDNNDSFSCVCPTSTLDVNGDGSFCRDTQSNVAPGGNIPDTACPDEGCPTGQFCGKKPAGGDVCVIINLNPTDENDDVDDPETFCKKVENADECCTEELKAKCDSNNYCGVHPDRGPVCFCNPGWWQVHPGGFCREETSNCANCAPSNSQCIKNVCSCSSGYIGNGNTCIDQNECDLKLDNCAAGQGCVNTDGGFKCIDIVVDPTPAPVPIEPTLSPSRRPVPRPVGLPLVIAPLVVTLTLDDEAASENSFEIFNTFDNDVVLLESFDLEPGPLEKVSPKTWRTDGCYTFALYDAGTGATDGLSNKLAPQVQIRIGNRILLDKKLVPEDTRNEFGVTTFRFGSGCLCSRGKTAYDIKAFGLTRLSVYDVFTGLKGPSGVLYTAVTPFELVDTRLCLSSCHTVKLEGVPRYFEVTKAKGNNIDVDDNDYKIVNGAYAGGEKPVTLMLLGDNCCRPGSKLLYQSFFNPGPSTPIPIISRELNAVPTVFELDTEGFSSGRDISSNSLESLPFEISECVSEVTCLRYQIPTIAGLSYLINYGDEVRASTSTTTDANAMVDVTFGTMCGDAGSLMISLETGGKTGTSIIVTHINSGEVASYVPPTKIDAPQGNGSIDLTLSPSSECYSVIILNTDGNADGSIKYDVKLKGKSILQTKSPFPFPEESDLTAMYDTVRFGSCECNPFFYPVDAKLLVLGNTDSANSFGIFEGSPIGGTPYHSQKLKEGNFVYDFGGCFAHNDDYYMDIRSIATSSEITYSLSLDISEEPYQRTSAGFEVIQLLICDPTTHDEVELFTESGIVQFTSSTIFESAIIDSAFVSLIAPRACIPRIGCTKFSLVDPNGVFNTDPRPEFTFENQDRSVSVSDGLFPFAPFYNGEDCVESSIVVTIEGGSANTKVYAYDSALPASELVLDDPVTDSTSQTFIADLDDPFACYTVAIVDTDGTLDAAIINVALIEDETVTLPESYSFDKASEKFYQYYEIGLCGCGANSDFEEVNLLWYTPPNASDKVASITIVERKGNVPTFSDMNVRNNFLYNYNKCVIPSKDCVGVEVASKEIDGVGDIEVDPLNFYHVFLGENFMFSGIYNKDVGGDFTGGCCAPEQFIYVVSYHIGRDPNHELGVMRTVTVVQNGMPQVASVLDPEGSSFIQHYCVDFLNDSNCAQIQFGKFEMTSLNFGVDGFLRVSDTANTFTLPVGDDTGEDSAIQTVSIGSNECIDLFSAGRR